MSTQDTTLPPHFYLVPAPNEEEGVAFTSKREAEAIARRRSMPAGVPTIGDAFWDAYEDSSEFQIIEVQAIAAQAPQPLESIEQYRLQMAGISTAAIGYWKIGDGIHPDYDTLALRDVAKLYAKYDALYKAQQAQGVPADYLMADGETTLKSYLADASPPEEVMDEWTQGYEECKRRLFKIIKDQVLASAPQAEPQPEREPERKPLTDAQIEKLREQTFSTSNPFCPCDSKTMRKAVWAAERAHGIGTKGGDKLAEPIAGSGAGWFGKYGPAEDADSTKGGE